MNIFTIKVDLNSYMGSVVNTISAQYFIYLIVIHGRHQVNADNN